ncbi:MAG: c-type cytochrome [Gemmatimonadetes bacterium]|nr:c-type cytochrome [Gemmatimonadota bacterium]
MTKAGDDRPIMDHEYDGIKEYDNPMPRWWLLLFLVTILLVPVYYFAPGDIGHGAKKEAMYQKEMAAFKAAHPDAGGGTVTPEQMAAIVADKAEVEKGKALFAVNCVSCHRADGGGLIGPNLTDDYWIHGGTPVEIHTTIDQGVLAKGMPNWGKILKPDQINSLTAYVVSLHGSTPANPKAPDGVLVAATPAAAASAPAAAPAKTP